MIYTLLSLIGDKSCQTNMPGTGGRWVRAVPLPYYGGYIKGAWAVLTGKAVAVRYPVTGELEAAIAKTGGL